MTAAPRLRPPFRLWLLLALTLAWGWAQTPYAPWAPSRDPLTWLYDLFFYLRFALGGWWLLETLRLLRDLSRRRCRPRWPARAALLAATAAAAMLGTALYDSGIGLRLLARQSQPMLVRATEIPAADADRRRRIGAFLIDNQRVPCSAAQPWLWLGQVFGAGTGTNLALVHSPDAPPLTPFTEAFRFWPLHGGWWLAYQDGHAYQLAWGRIDRRDAACTPGQVVDTHAQGRAFVAQGRSKWGH